MAPLRSSASRARSSHRLDRYADYIVARYDAGRDSEAHLTRALRERAYRGSEGTVRRYLADVRAPRPRGSATPAPAAVPVPAPRAAAWLLARRGRPRATRGRRACLRPHLGEGCPELARRLAGRFAHVLASRDPNALASWLDDAHRSELKSFAAGIERNRDAVLAALCFRWSNGQVEGRVHRIKLVKRSMFGRANFDLLRRRGLRAA